MSEMIEGDLTDEEYREYQFLNAGGLDITYRIYSPKTLYTRVGGTTHRVLDSDGIVHCVPAVGTTAQVVLRWKPRAGTKPVAF